jgi:hypothetical protein
MVLVTESWHLTVAAKTPSDGKHIISIENKTLDEQDYKNDYFPFVFMRWTQSHRLASSVKGLADSNFKVFSTKSINILKTIQDCDAPWC